MQNYRPMSKSAQQYNDVGGSKVVLGGDFYHRFAQ